MMFQRNILPPSSQSKREPSKKAADAGNKLSEPHMEKPA
jgi:hypothetical protein